jgi:CRP-like cAMP-binding protein
MVNFLQGDAIIETGEHGDALYVIVRGDLEVRVASDAGSKLVARLAANDFFGEMALLGDHIRKADVIADTSCILLRIKCNDVLKIAERYPAITRRLNEVQAERSKQ